MSYGKRIRAARAAEKLTQGELAKSAGLAPQTIVDLENGRIGITTAEYQRLRALIEMLVLDRETSATAT